MDYDFGVVWYVTPCQVRCPGFCIAYKTPGQTTNFDVAILGG